MTSKANDKGADKVPFFKWGGLGEALLKLLRLGGRRLLLALLALASLSLAAYIALYGDGFNKARVLRQEKERLESEIGRLEEENRLLMERIERIKTDPGYVEDEARRKLGLVKPGETIYRLSEEPDWQPGERETEP